MQPGQPHVGENHLDGEDGRMVGHQRPSSAASAEILTGFSDTRAPVTRTALEMRDSEYPKGLIRCDTVDQCE